MTDYSKATDFASKDALTSGDPDKVVKGTEIDDEFTAIATSIATKADRAGPTFTGTSAFANMTVSGTLTANGTIDVAGGAIDGTTIGASSASTGAFTTLTASGRFTTEDAVRFNPTDGSTDYFTYMVHYGTGTDFFSISVIDWAQLAPVVALSIAESTGVVTMPQGMKVSEDKTLTFGDNTSGISADGLTGITIENSENDGTGNDDINIKATGASSVGDVNFTPGGTAGRVKGVVRGTAITGSNGILEAVTSLPGTPDADTIYFVTG